MPPLCMYVVMAPRSTVPGAPVHSNPIAKRSHTSQRSCEKIALWRRVVGATLVVAPGRPQGPPLEPDFFTASKRCIRHC
jgi:hypothetical protein